MYKTYGGYFNFLKKRPVIIIAAMHLAALPAHGQDLAMFVNDARKNNPHLQSLKHQARTRQFEARAESIFSKNPVLSVAHSNSPVGHWPSLGQHAMSGLEVSLQQTFSFPWEVGYRKKARFQVFLSQQELQYETQATIELQVKQVFQQIHFLYRKEELLKESKNSLQNIVTQARALVSVDKMSSSHLLKLEADLVILENDLLHNRSELHIAQANLDQLCGKNYDWAAPWGSEAWLKQGETSTVPTGFKVENHPLYRAMSYSLEAAEASRAHTKASLFPDVTIGASYRFRQEVSQRDNGEDFISLKASTPLPLYYPLKEHYQISAAHEKFLGLKAERENVKSKLIKKWQGERGRARQLKQVYQRYNTEVMPRYLASFKAQRGALSAGTVTLLDVLDSYRQYLKVSIQSAQSLKELNQSIAFLEYLQTTSNKKKEERKK